MKKRKNNKYFYGAIDLYNERRYDMKTNNETIVDETIDDLLDELSTTDPSTDEYKKVAEQLTVLCKVQNEKQRLQLELDETKQKDLMNKVRLGIDAAGLVLPLIFYGLWMKRGFEFEKEGTFTSTTFRGLFNRFRPTK